MLYTQDLTNHSFGFGSQPVISARAAGQQGFLFQSCPGSFGSDFGPSL